MTDRVQHLTVYLSSDHRTDDVEALMNAIKMLQGVRDVELGKCLNGEDYLARMKAGQDLGLEINHILRKYIGGGL